MATQVPADIAGSPKDAAVNKTVEQPIYVLQSEHERTILQRNHSIVRIANIIETAAMYESDAMLLKTRRDMLRECYKNFDQAQNWLEQLFPDETEKRDEVEIQFVAGLAMFDKAIANKRVGAEPKTSGDLVRLPSVDLPTFSGSNEIGWNGSISLMPLSINELHWKRFKSLNISNYHFEVLQQVLSTRCQQRKPIMQLRMIYS